MLYQQGTQKIEVVVTKRGGSSNEGELEGGKGTKETSPEDSTSSGSDTAGNEAKGMSSRTKRIIKTNVTHAIAASKQLLNYGIEYWVGGIGYRNGDQSLQEQTARTVEMIEDPVSIGMAFGQGALYGAWGGIPGAIIGSLINGGMTIASKAMKYANRNRDYDWKVFKEENAIEYSRARAGINLTTGRLR